MSVSKSSLFFRKTYLFLKNFSWLRYLVSYIKRPYRKIRVKLHTWSIQRKVNSIWINRSEGKKHNLPSQLIISLTSYPARFRTLPLTLKCLLSQTVKADRVILWIAHQDKDALTQDILSLESVGLEILYCDDLKSYKKIIPTLKILPDAFIVTADDDVYYWETWLEEFANAYAGDTFEVLCHRAHTIRLDSSGLPLPYNEWKHEIEDNDPSPLNFPTGIGGVMYPPNIFHSDILATEIYEKYCSRADDIWLYWMARCNGAKSRKIGCKHPFITWPDSQTTALWLENVIEGGNDMQIRSMISKYGFSAKNPMRRVMG